MFEDTAPEMLAFYHARLRQQTLKERAMALDAMIRDSQRMGIIGLRMRHPGASDEELRLMLFVNSYGREWATRIYGKIPDDAK